MNQGKNTYFVAIKEHGLVDMVFVKAHSQVEAVLHACIELDIDPDCPELRSGQGFTVGIPGGIYSIDPSTDEICTHLENQARKSLKASS